MTPMSIDARRRLEEHLASLQRSMAARQGKDAGGDASRELAETQAALERIAQGTYGRCETCDGAIGRQRLLALPTTRFCIACVVTAAGTTR